MNVVGVGFLDQLRKGDLGVTDNLLVESRENVSFGNRQRGVERALDEVREVGPKLGEGGGAFKTMRRYGKARATCDIIDMEYDFVLLKSTDRGRLL